MSAAALLTKLHHVRDDPLHVLACASRSTPLNANHASLEKVQKQWRRASLQCHPDKHAGDDEGIWTQITQCVHAAWQQYQEQRATGACAGAARRSVPQERGKATASAWQSSGRPMCAVSHLRFFDDDGVRIYAGSPAMADLVARQFEQDYSTRLQGDANHVGTPIAKAPPTASVARICRFIDEMYASMRLQRRREDKQRFTIEITNTERFFDHVFRDMMCGVPTANWFVNIEREDEHGHTPTRDRDAIDGNWNGMLRTLGVIRWESRSVPAEVEHLVRPLVHMRIRNYLLGMTDSPEERRAARAVRYKMRAGGSGKKKRRRSSSSSSSLAVASHQKKKKACAVVIDLTT